MDSRSVHGYQIEELVGRGGFAQVFRAKSKSGQTVALKELHPGSSSQVLRRFTMGGRSQRMLDHPGIVSVVDLFEGGIVMEYVSELDLKKEIQRLRLGRAKLRTQDTDVVLKALDPLGASCAAEAGSSVLKLDPSYVQQVGRWGLQMAEALAFAHEKGVVHRDVKPSNVLLTDSGTAMVTDFDLAFQIANQDRMTLTGDHACTLDYCSPEQADGKLARDCTTDVYSLGVVLFELLTLTLPFESTEDGRNDPAHTRDAARRAPRADDRAEGAPSPFVDIIERCLLKFPEDRYPSATELSADLRQFVNREPFTVRQLSHWQKLKHLVELHRMWTAVIAGLLLIVVGGWAFLGYSKWDDLLTAQKSGDVETLVDAYDDLGIPFRWFIDDEVDIGVSTENPIRRVAGKLRRDRGDGFRLAASFVRQDGILAHPVFARMFESAISSEGETERFLAMRWLGRAALEAPCYDPEQAAAFFGIRDGVWKAIEDDQDDHRPRVSDLLWSFAILASCGGIEDAARIVQWLSSSESFREQERVAITAVGHITLRTLKCGGKDRDSDLRELRGDLLHQVRRLLAADPEATHLDLKVAWDEFITAAAVVEYLSERPVNGGSSWVTMNPGCWRFDFLKQLCEDPSSVQKTLLEKPLLGEGAMRGLGWKCGLLNQDSITDRVRQMLNDPGFDSTHRQWFEGARTNIVDRRIPSILDPNSLLTPNEAVVQRTIYLRQGSASTSSVATPSPTGLIASWRFRDGSVRYQGAASSVGLHDAALRHWEVGESHLRLWKAGVSRAELRFELDSAIEGEIYVVVDHSAAQRRQFPHKGEAVVEILLDGKMEVAKSTFHNQHIDTFKVFEGRVSKGEHTLTIGLEFNTTTYWLYGLELRVGR